MLVKVRYGSSQPGEVLPFILERRAQISAGSIVPIKLSYPLRLGILRWIGRGQSWRAHSSSRCMSLSALFVDLVLTKAQHIGVVMCDAGMSVSC